jgi:pimeloyl-ACP methyl ester carboxylesterase
MAKHKMSDVVVLLPGIMGSVLQRDGRDVWAPSAGAAMRALWSLGRSLKQLQLHDDPWDKDDLGDGVVATRLAPDLHLVPGLWSIDGYSAIGDMIKQKFDVVPGVTYNELPYDWRRDNRVAARALHRLAEEKLAIVRKDNPQAKLILIGHSMGGLVARYFLECMDGWKDTRMLVTFGTPHRGSLNAVDFLANGFVKKAGPLKLLDLTTLLRSLTSVYQLLPIYPCVDLGNGYVRPAEVGTAIAGLDAARASTALQQFHRAIEAGAGQHDQAVYQIHSVVGITQGTKQSARLAGSKLVVEEHYSGNDMGGDGTVPRVSATPVETDAWVNPYQPMFATDRHGSLQNADPVHAQLLGILTQQPLGGFKGGSGLRLQLDEGFEMDEDIHGQVLASVPNVDLAARVVNLESGQVVRDAHALRRDADDIHHLELPSLPAGDYRIEVTGLGDSAGVVDPVHGLVCVDAGEDAALGG